MNALLKLKRVWLAIGIAMGVNNAQGLSDFIHRVILALATR
jgi:hypothetical protein